MPGEMYLNENWHPGYNCAIVSMVIGLGLLTKCTLYFVISFYIKTLQQQ